MCNPGCPRTISVVQAGLELTEIYLPLHLGSNLDQLETLKFLTFHVTVNVFSFAREPETIPASMSQSEHLDSLRNENA